jgi:xanthosine utilization system XapX-like protein
MSLPDTSAATSALPIPGLSTVTGALQSSISNLINTGSGYLDRFFPPEKREAWKAWLVKFATEKPALASFLLSQLALSGPAIALFFIMTITVVIFALLAGILVGLIGALLFIVAAVGFALIILLPVLFFTTAAAVFFWLWGIGTYYIVKWFNEKPVPGIHESLPGGVAEQSGLKDLPGLNGEPLLGGGEDSGKGGDQAPRRPAREKEEGKATGAQTHHHGDGKENSTEGGASPAQQRKAKKSTAGSGGGGGADGAVKDGVGQVHNTVGGVTKKVGVGQ